MVDISAVTEPIQTGEHKPIEGRDASSLFFCFSSNAETHGARPGRCLRSRYFSDDALESAEFSQNFGNKNLNVQQVKPAAPVIA